MGGMPGVPPSMAAWSGYPKQEERSEEDVINDNQKTTKYEILLYLIFKQIKRRDHRSS